MPRRYLGEDHFKESRPRFRAQDSGDSTRPGCCIWERPAPMAPLDWCPRPIAVAGVVELRPTRGTPLRRMRAFACAKHAELLEDARPFGAPEHYAEVERRRKARAEEQWPITPDGRL